MENFSVFSIPLLLKLTNMSLSVNLFSFMAQDVWEAC